MVGGPQGGWTAAGQQQRDEAPGRLPRLLRGSLGPGGLLDRFKISRRRDLVNQAYDELKTIVARASPPDRRCVQTIRTSSKRDDNQDDDFKPLEHKIVAKTHPE